LADFFTKIEFNLLIFEDLQLGENLHPIYLAGERITRSKITLEEKKPTNPEISAI